MDIAGEYVIDAPRQVVWDALNDAETLKAAIPGCQEIEKTSDTGFNAKVQAKVGPVKATFTGSVTLSDLDPPNGYTISGEGKGGAAGFAKGGAKVALEDADDGGTKLSYTVSAQVGGKLAQIGSRLIQGTAKKYADDFFATFAELAKARAATSAPPVTEEAPAPEPEAPAPEPDAPTPEADSPTPEPEAPVEAPLAEQAPPPASSAPTPAPNPQPESADPADEKAKGLSPIVWVGGAVVIVLLLILAFA